MNKDEASLRINAFIHEFFPDACYTKNSEVSKGGDDSEFYKMLKDAGRNGPGIELWYENWKGKWIFALAMFFSKDTFEKHFPNYTKSEYYVADCWDCQKMPKFGRLCFQSNGRNYYLSLYIKEGSEYKSIQKFYANQDVKNICHFGDKCTERFQQSWARIGQGVFRDKMIKMWNGACSVTGCKMKEVLVASHAIPWRDCNPKEKVDEHNGLLLVPNLDALFDKFFITFDEKGRIQIRKEIEKECKKLNITKNMKVDLARLENESERKNIQHFLAEHRKYFGKYVENP